MNKTRLVLGFLVALATLALMLAIPEVARSWIRDADRSIVEQ